MKSGRMVVAISLMIGLQQAGADTIETTHDFAASRGLPGRGLLLLSYFSCEQPVPDASENLFATYGVEAAKPVWPWSKARLVNDAGISAYCWTMVRQTGEEKVFACDAVNIGAEKCRLVDKSFFVTTIGPPWRTVDFERWSKSVGKKVPPGADIYHLD